MSKLKRLTASLAAVATIMSGLVLIAPAASAAPQISPEVTRLFELTNQARTSRGLAPLKLDTRLTEIAQDWSNTQARENRMYHRPNFANGYPAGWQWAGENVVSGSKSLNADALFNAWMNSPGHRDNILRSSTTHIGIGWAGNGTNNFSTQNFGQFAKDPSPVIIPGGGTTPTPPTGISNAFHLTNNLTLASQVSQSFSYGNPGETILVGDWDGDGKDTLAIRRGNTYHFTNGTDGKAAFSFSYGNPSDEVLVGDWDGDGKDTLAVRRGNTFHMKNSFTNGGSADFTFAYGNPSDAVVVGDWNGDGKDTLGVRRGNTYHMKNSFTNGGNADFSFSYGNTNDEILVGDWDGDGKDTITVRRGGNFHIKNSFTGGGEDRLARYGNPGDIVFSGDWDGDGKDTVGVRR